MRANYQAHAASGTLFSVKFQRNYIRKINKSVHNMINLVKIHPVRPNETIDICAGKAVFISF